MIDRMEYILKQHPNAPAYIKIGYLKEVIQIYILEHIYEQSYAKQLWFYGWTAMRLLHGLDRLSEDLDFVGMNFQAFDELALSLTNHFQSLWFEVSSKRQYFRITLSFYNLLNRFGLQFENSNTLRLKVEISDHFAFAKDYEILSYPKSQYGRNFAVKSFRIQDLMGTKLNAVLYRSWTNERKGVTFKWRDMYDLYWYLMKHIKPTLGCVDGVETYSDLKRKLLEKIESLDMSQAIQDIQYFIEDPKQLEIFQLYAKEFVIREISNW